MRRRRRSQPQALGSMVGRVLDEVGLDAAAAAFRIAERWEALVGPEVASHCRPTGVRGGVLETMVDSSVWSQQILLLRPRILEALRRELGEEAPRDLRCRVGYNRPS